MIGEVLKKEVDSSKVIVFDDLERSAIKPKTLLGVINHYVEHYGCRVVVIAHEQKLVKGFNEAKEKIFGQTIRIEPDLESAYQAFLVEIKKSDAENFIADYSEAIKTIFKESEVNSLRILRQAMFDVTRLFEALEDRHRQNRKAMQVLVPLFVAHDFEVRGGRFSQSELERHWSSMENDAFVQAESRYAEINLSNLLLKDEVLVQMLIQGRYEPSVIRASLDDSVYFKRLDEIPNWRKVLEFDSLDDITVKAASEALDVEFNNRSINDFGALLHVFALRMMMARHGIRVASLADVEVECKSYVDDLLCSGRLLPNFNEFDDSTLGRSSYGYGYWVEEDYKDTFGRVRVRTHNQ